MSKDHADTQSSFSSRKVTMNAPHKPRGLTYLGIGNTAMTNLCHFIDLDVEDRLRQEKVYASHAAWNFHGDVWWNGTQFCEEVWVSHSPREILYAESLHELMVLVNDKYGWE
jgi:hypothetical protein